MNRTLTLLFGLLVACGPSTDPSAPAPVEDEPPAMAAPPTPRTVVVVGKQDFGRILQGDSPKVRYELRNEGEGTLIIERFKTSCGCTDVIVEPMQVLAGQSCTVDVTFKTDGRHGKQNRTVTLFTNDPDKPRVRLQVLAEIYRVINPEPEVLDLGVLFQGETTTASVELTSTDTSAFRVTGVDCRDTNVAFEWTCLQEDPSRYRIDATLSPTAPVGWAALVDAWVLVEHERHEKIKLSLRGQVKLPVRIEPESSLNVGEILPGTPVERIIKLTNLKPEMPLSPPQVSVISSVNRILARAEGGYEELVHAEVREVEAGQNYEVVVRVDDRIPQPQFVALVQLQLGGKDARPHTVAVRGSVKVGRRQ